MDKTSISRRDLLKGGAVTVAGIAAASGTLSRAEAMVISDPHNAAASNVNGRVRNGSIDPLTFLEHFEFGEIERLADGKVRRRSRDLRSKR